MKKDEKKIQIFGVPLPPLSKPQPAPQVLFGSHEGRPLPEREVEMIAGDTPPARPAVMAMPVDPCF